MHRLLLVLIAIPGLALANPTNSWRVFLPVRKAEDLGYTGYQRHYALEATPGLTHAAWQGVPVLSNFPALTNGTSTHIESGNPTNLPKFFRARSWLDTE